MLKLPVLLLLSVYITGCFAQSYHTTLARALDLFKNAAEFNVSAANSQLNRHNQAYEAIKDSIYDFIQNYDPMTSTDLAAMPNISTACLLQGLALIQGLQSKQLWALSREEIFLFEKDGIGFQFKRSISSICTFLWII